MGQAKIVFYDADFTRWNEIVKYAEQRGITEAWAIIELVNKGLSHLDD